jgi:3-hydroxybutyryl-CoA dehydrogenase
MGVHPAPRPWYGKIMIIAADRMNRLAVLGAGTMGSGIAQVAVSIGLEVVLRDLDAGLVERGVQRVRENLDGAVARGKLDAPSRDRALGRLSGTVDLKAAVADADAVIEAIVEDLEVKRRLFVELDSETPARALLASNTSSLPIGEIARGTLRPERVVGMHFFNPVYAMKLIEIIRHPTTSDDAVTAARGLGVRLGKDPIVVKDSPGFASSRLGVLAGLEAMRMVEENVASAADIDKAMKLGYGYPMGPLELGDIVGLDVRLAISEHLWRTLGERFRPPELLRRMVSEGKLGRKSGQGFYAWRDGKRVD